MPQLSPSILPFLTFGYFCVLSSSSGLYIRSLAALTEHRETATRSHAAIVSPGWNGKQADACRKPGSSQ